MSDPLFHLGWLEERASGVFQFSLNCNSSELSREIFTELGLVLPTALEKAILKRQLDYLAGRYCVRRIYEARDLQHLPLPHLAEDRSPEWPEGWVGSITHTRGWASAVLAAKPSIEAVGCDLEYLIEGRSPGLPTQICCDVEELRQVAQVFADNEQIALTLIFSAKESLFKALYPQVKRFFGFHAARVHPLGPQSLRVELLEDLYPFGKGQSWAVDFRARSSEVWETLLVAPSTKG